MVDATDGARADVSPEGIHLLLVDDDEALRHLTAAQLRKKGYAVDEAQDGVVGLERALAQHPDIIVTDLMMPRLDGLGFCTEVRNQPAISNAYVIMLTAKDRPEDIVRGLESQADDYITKPFSMPEFLARVAAGARLKLLQNRLLQTNQALEQALAVQARFLGLAAHDLRAPLSIINTYISLLGQDVVGVDEIREVCLRRTQGLMQLVDDLLDITKIENGTVHLEIGDHPLAPLVHLSIDLFQPVAREYEGHIELSPVPADLVCRCDPRRFANILENLLSNAIKYSEGPPQITVRVAADETTAAITVQDEGLGISVGDLERIFEPFATVEAEMDGQVPHTGLGLAICRKLTQLQGGTISAESAGPGHGASFRFTVPLSTTS